MKYRTTNLATQVAAIVALPMALSLSACGGQSAETPAVDDSNIGQAKEKLYGDTSSCLGASGGFNTVLPPGVAELNDGEASLTGRSSTCAAWVVTYDYITPPSTTLQSFFSSARDMPTNQQDCVYSWTSDKVVGRHNGAYQTLHDLDSPFQWNQGRCFTSGASHLPHESNTGPILQFNRNSSFVQDRLSYYNRIRFIAQPFWVYWAVAGRIQYST